MLDTYTVLKMERSSGLEIHNRTQRATVEIYEQTLNCVSATSWAYVEKAS